MKFLKVLCLLSLCLLIACADKAERKLFKEAQNEWNQRRYNNALEKYNQLVEKFPDGMFADESLLRIGETYRLNLNREQEALIYFYRLVRNGGREYQLTAQENIANIFKSDLMDYDQAIIEYQKLINMDPRGADNDRHQYDIAQCYFKKGDYFQAITELEILLKKYPASRLAEGAVFMKYNCYFILGSCNKAVKGYRDFLSRYPESRQATEARYSIGNCLEEKEKLHEALEIYKDLKKKGFNGRLIDIKIKGIETRLKKRRR